MPPLIVHCLGEQDGKVRVACQGIIARDALLFNDSPEDSLDGKCFAQNVLLDLSDCERIDSAGVSWLIRFHKRCTEAGGRLILHSLPPMVVKTLKLLNMGLLLSIADNEQGACKIADGASDA